MTMHMKNLNNKKKCAIFGTVFTKSQLTSINVKVGDWLCHWRDRYRLLVKAQNKEKNHLSSTCFSSTWGTQDTNKLAWIFLCGNHFYDFPSSRSKKGHSWLVSFQQYPKRFIYDFRCCYFCARKIYYFLGKFMRLIFFSRSFSFFNCFSNKIFDKQIQLWIM